MEIGGGTQPLARSHRGKVAGIEEDDPGGVDGRGGCHDVARWLPVRQTRGSKEGSSSARTTAQVQKAGQTQRTQGGDLGQAQSELICPSTTISCIFQTGSHTPSSMFDRSVTAIS
jgi:hypothetical protein